MITPQETDAGLLAYEQVRAFDSLRRKKLPLIYTVFPLLLATMGIAAAVYAAPMPAAICVGSAAAFAIFAFWNWRRLRALDGLNRALLAQLQAKYGDDLPWLQVERQQAAIRKIQTEQTDGAR